MTNDALLLDVVYGHRFTKTGEERKDALWREVVRYPQRYVPEDGAVRDIACDRAEFTATCARPRTLPDGVSFVQGDGLALDSQLPSDHSDTVFTSNYLEHLPSGDAVIEQFRAAGKLVRPGGRVVVLQPNIRLTGMRYWDSSTTRRRSQNGASSRLPA